jgi:hypothetical protein
MLTLYQVLALPSAASRDDIRAAYRRQMSRIRTGELPASLKDAVEQAYATLDHPDRRLEYDLGLAASMLRMQRTRNAVALPRRSLRKGRELSRAAARRLRPALQWPPLPQPLIGSFAVRATVLAGFAALCLVVGMQISGGGHGTPAGSHETARSSAAPSLPATPPPAAVATEYGAPAEPQASDVGNAPPPDTENAPQPDAETPPVVQAVSPRPVLMARSPLPVAAGQTALPAEASPSAASPAPTPDEPVAAVPAPSTPQLTTVTIVRTRPVTGERDVTMIVGRYCRDSSGGEIFTPINTPAPGLTC